ncbi:casein kinase 2 regulatory subunit [Cladochytrium tenue]|nr:casein kinase 2 regulatory subunit [Cladochytrium tenue]
MPTAAGLAVLPPAADAAPPPAAGVAARSLPTPRCVEGASRQGGPVTVSFPMPAGADGQGKRDVAFRGSTSGTGNTITARASITSVFLHDDDAIFNLDQLSHASNSCDNDGANIFNVDVSNYARAHSGRGSNARGPTAGMFSGGYGHDRHGYDENGENMDDEFYQLPDGEGDDNDDFDNGHEFFLEVPEDFIEDDFNLTGLNTLVLLYSDALDVILDLEPKQRPTDAQMSLIESSAEMLYGLIHQRFLVTKQGLSIMADRLKEREFGTCPREECNYPIRSSRRRQALGTTSGAARGTDEDDEEDDLPDYHVYVPKIFGFRINEKSLTGPRMAWLRWREGLPVPGVRPAVMGAESMMQEDGDIFEGAGDDLPEGIEEDE